ncbi:hypothetical protein C4564_04720 [Candidatus Microgenomates bacterium]|nr:MAG: hypothetical protein C4564_04720 [Candidatus Microgenomates bacterium]
MKKIIFVTILFLQFAFFSTFSRVHAQTSCDMDVSPSLIQEGDTVTLTAVNIIEDDVPATASPDRSYYIWVPEAGAGYTIPTTALVNGHLNITLLNDDNGNPLFTQGRSYTIQLVRNAGFGTSHPTICTANQQVTVEQSNSQEICYNTTIEPTTGPEGAVFTLTASGCLPGDIYNMVVSGASGQPIYYLPRASNVGFIEQKIQGLAAGNYEVRFFHTSTPSRSFYGYITVAKAEDATLICGQAVPPGTPTCSDGEELGCCPADCPSEGRTAPGDGTGSIQQMCGCGLEGERACPPGNALNLPACVTPFTPNSDGICAPAQGGGDGYSRYFCGEEIYPEDVATGNYTCVNLGCPTQALDGGRYWCACGEPGYSCCPEPPTNTSENNFIGVPGCRGKAICIEATQMCFIPTEAKGAASMLARGCEDVGYIFTAIGCIKSESAREVAKFLYTWSAGFAGGVGLLVMITGFAIIGVSSGDPRKMSGGKDLVISAVAGLAMILLSAFLLRVIGIDVIGLFA